MLRVRLADNPPLFQAASLSRFSLALFVALALHGVLVAPLWRRVAVAPLASNKGITGELLIELESITEQPSAAKVELGAPSVGAAFVPNASRAPKPRAVQSSAAYVLTATTADPSATFAMAEDSGLLPPSTVSTPQPELHESAAPKINLGLDGSLFRPRLRDVEAKPSTGRDLQVKMQRDLNTSLLAHDLKLGLARGNVLVGSLSSAVRTLGPAGGEAVVQLTLNSLGELIGLEMLRGTTGDWSAALRSFREQAKRKRVRVPSGAQGLRVTYNVTTKIQRPSGKDVDSSAIGVKLPTLAPNGAPIGGHFDLTDLSNKTSRMVYARVLSEEVL